MNALFIGRFQPFHLGHMHVIKQNFNLFKLLYIGIGSSQYSNTFENPFSFAERETMIKAALNDEGINNYSIVAIPDIHNPPKWVDHIISIINDSIELITNNSETAELFKKKGFNVHKDGLYKKQRFSGQEIRERMRCNKPWNELVHPKVYEYLCSIDAEQRLKSI
ncbi:nicotinamide-nucleotide adenylyltransferase [Thermoplasmatales archaeon ex4572_165]|nr:MAG: nicotinamide-nucleotide adenylyltransferase [Thermoplasmatales archaeon ex4572_165]RLF59278.1 MAG: nicotinamide-nucleotide adenylyltransferase [Thermoplasmata archaeon]